MTSSTKRPWYMFYPLAGMLLLCALWCGYWYIAFGVAKDLVHSKRQEFINQGLQLDCAKESWGGFPFRFEFQCEAASLQFTQANKTIDFQSVKILAVAQAYNPFHVLLLIDGPSSVDGIKLTHGRALVSVTVKRSGDWNISSDVAEANAQGLFSGDQLNFYGRKINGKLDIAANAESLIVLGPDNSVTPITKAELIAQTSASYLEQPTRAAAAGEPLEISSLKISQGPVDFAAHGRIFLDPQHRLAGKLSSQTNDIDGLMNIISPLFELNGKDRATVTNLLGLIGSDPKINVTKADLIARDGMLYWGLFKLADLEPLY